MAISVLKQKQKNEAFKTTKNLKSNAAIKSCFPVLNNKA